MSLILGHISSVLNISVRKAISRLERCKLLSCWWQKNDTWPQFSPAWTITGETKIVFFPPSAPPPPTPCPCCLLPTATWAWILSPVSRLEIVDSDLVVKLELDPVDGTALKEQVYLKPKERLHVRREPGFSLSQTSWSASVLIVSTKKKSAHFQFLLYGVINQEINKCVAGLCHSQRQWAFCIFNQWVALNIINGELRAERMKNGGLVWPLTGYFSSPRQAAFMRIWHALEARSPFCKRVIKRNHYIFFFSFGTHAAFPWLLISSIFQALRAFGNLCARFFQTSKCFSIWQTVSWSLHRM